MSAAEPTPVVETPCSTMATAAHKTAEAKLGVALGTTYELTQPEVERCYAIAVARNKANVAGGRTNMNFSGRDDLMVSFQGLVGELAYMRMFGLNDEGLDDTTCRNAATDTFDATMSGHSVDVKTVIRRNAGILIAAWKKNNCPALYALLYCKGIKQIDTYRPDMKISITFLGMCPSKWVIRPENLKTLFKDQKEFYEYKQEDLVTWDFLCRKQTVEEMKEAQKKEAQKEAHNNSLSFF